MAKIIINSDNFVKTPGNQGCKQCPLGSMFRCDCIRYFEFLFGSRCDNVKVEVKKGLDEIEFKK